MFLFFLFFFDVLASEFCFSRLIIFWVPLVVIFGFYIDGFLYVSIIDLLIDLLVALSVSEASVFRNRRFIL